MKVLLYSPVFLPHVGGLEYNVAHLAESLAARGVEIVVLTRTPSAVPDRFPFQVVRRPTAWRFLALVRWCDVFFQANVSLRGLWPLLLVRRPWVVSHHGWYSRPDGSRAWQDRLKRLLLRRAAASIGVSQAVADDLETPTIVIPNTYRETLFRRLRGVNRDRDLIFVGRLVSDKGADLLLEALARLAEAGRRPRLAIVGGGPEEEPLRAQARRLGLDGQVEFLGVRSGEELVRLLNAHRILVVPSRYNEPFGIVALEGIACGCVVVGSQGGGLKEAIGPCGPTFRNGDVTELAARLEELLAEPVRLEEYRAHAALHLERHATRQTVDAYQAVLIAAAGTSPAGAPR